METQAMTTEINPTHEYAVVVRGQVITGPISGHEILATAQAMADARGVTVEIHPAGLVDDGGIVVIEPSRRP